VLTTKQDGEEGYQNHQDIMVRYPYQRKIICIFGSVLHPRRNCSKAPTQLCDWFRRVVPVISFNCEIGTKPLRHTISSHRHAKSRQAHPSIVFQWDSRQHSLEFHSVDAESFRALYLNSIRKGQPHGRLRTNYLSEDHLNKGETRSKAV
jgi:hypothetical protein